MRVYPFVDDQLSNDAFAAMEVAPSDGVETITAAFRSWLPADSTAKWLAVEAGRVPPGHDVSRGDAWAAWVPGDGPGERSDHLGIRGGGGTFRYRMVSDRLERPEVAEGISPFEQRRRVVAHGPYEELRTRIDRPRVDA